MWTNVRLASNKVAKYISGVEFGRKRFAGFVPAGFSETASEKEKEVG